MARDHGSGAGLSSATGNVMPDGTAQPGGTPHRTGTTAPAGGARPGIAMMKERDAAAHAEGGGHDLPTEHDDTDLPGADGNPGGNDSGAGYGNHEQPGRREDPPAGTEIPDDDIDRDAPGTGLGKPDLLAGDAAGAAAGSDAAETTERRDG